MLTVAVSLNESPTLIGNSLTFNSSFSTLSIFSYHEFILTFDDSSVGIQSNVYPSLPSSLVAEFLANTLDIV